MFGCLLGQIHFRDPDFLSVELVEGTNVITGPKCNKGLSVIAELHARAKRAWAEPHT